tara:strand:+ start:5096 stop:5407 length:312 start_codon:yes stop_codon:yes gene_type:complete
MERNKVLSVSGGNLQSDCKNLANTIIKIGFPVSITPNLSVVADYNKYSLQNGCRIVFSESLSRDEFCENWRIIRDKHDLGCGHLRLGFTKEICSEDFCKQNTK